MELSLLTFCCSLAPPRWQELTKEVNCFRKANGGVSPNEAVAQKIESLNLAIDDKKEEVVSNNAVVTADPPSIAYIAGLSLHRIET